MAAAASDGKSSPSRPSRALPTATQSFRASQSLRDAGSPRSAAKALVGYQESHQIEHFMQEMLTAVFAELPDDPFEFMAAHMAAHRPAPPPQEGDDLCGTAALWSLLPGGDLRSREHWRLRRCWLTSDGNFCTSIAPSSIRKSEQGLLIGKPLAADVHVLPVRPGTTFKVLGEDEVARPFAFTIVPGPDADPPVVELTLAAGSQEQREYWLNLLQLATEARNRRTQLRQ
mmetsp:Transcript_70562/g.132020  ORF Transcript_70562/g.132020 Transcript_70562/m.132020 type:complete len:229 (-) Transcript_70562:9-695(-)